MQIFSGRRERPPLRKRRIEVGFVSYMPSSMTLSIVVNPL